MTSVKLSIGNYAPVFILPCQMGGKFDSRHAQGAAMLWLFFPEITSPESQKLLLDLQALQEQFKLWDLTVIGISTDPLESLIEFTQTHQFPFFLISDQAAEMIQGLNLVKPDLPPGQIQAKFCSLLIHPNCKILKIHEAFDPSTHATQLLEDLKQLLPPQEPQHLTQIAPVLLISNVLPPEFCRELIEVWRTQGHGDSGFMVQQNGKTVGEYDYTHKIRKDHFVSDPDLINRLRYFMIHRIRPEILKAYHFDFTRFEDFRIACYESSRGGFFRRHRDNTTAATAHRRFAMTLNLNTEEYEGGYLRFPEYGPHLYRPETGSAVIFSCSLLHEATDVTDGDRFALLSFFYGEKEAQLREDMMQKSAAMSS